ncbi:fibroblast growth factor 1 isoform X1 [Cuculus canorus]|uniref:fibroblast growth factor 1 isoform X1 n=1 Tax=Cuculus canorus TaxID=55661 RepID=UPI0023AAD9C4|nr:fibroblast growth factor 1 isoform X1 [Cuculus canorus]
MPAFSSDPAHPQCPRPSETRCRSPEPPVPGPALLAAAFPAAPRGGFAAAAARLHPRLHPFLCPRSTRRSRSREERSSRLLRCCTGRLSLNKKRGYPSLQATLKSRVPATVQLSSAEGFHPQDGNTSPWPSLLYRKMRQDAAFSESVSTTMLLVVIISLFFSKELTHSLLPLASPTQ